METRNDAGRIAATPYTGPKEVAGYQILRELGSGGMGTVYEAYEEKMNRRVALKVLSRHLAPSQKAADRFAREAWIGGKLSHPNLVKIYERGDWEDLSFYSMELVDGGSLADVVHNLKQQGRDESWNLEFGSREYVHWAITQIITAARGLDYAHRQGVVHRDIKPMNLLLSREPGTIKIADFGLAIDAEMTRMTTAGKVTGTLPYMAPEQILGKQNEIDARADIYALGVTLFELLTLELPYAGKTQQLYVDAVLTAKARRPSKLNERVSRDLEIVIGKTLQKDRKDRYGSAGAFADDLDNVLHFRPIVARPSGLHERTLKWARRKPVHAALAGALLIGVPTLAVLTYRAVEHRELLNQMKIEELETHVRWLNQRGRHGEVVDASSEILQLKPDHLNALIIRGMSYLQLAESAQDPARATEMEYNALTQFSKLVELRPDVSWAHRWHAWVLSKFGREEEARKAEELALRYRTAHPEDEALYFEALLARDAGDHEQTIKLCSELIVRRPEWKDPILLRAYAHDLLGEIQKATNDYRVLLALDPGDYLAYYRLGHLLIQAGSVDEGAAYFHRALEVAPERAHASGDFSEILVELGRRSALEGDRAGALDHFKRAEATARRGLQREERDPWLHLNLGVSLIEQNRLLENSDPDLIGEAVAQYNQALSMWQLGESGKEINAYAATLVNQCEALIELGNLERALDACQEAARFGHIDRNAYYNLAGVYALMNRPDEAFRALEKDFELGDRDHLYLSSDPWFESIRHDPRFVDLVGRMRRAEPAT